LIQKVNTVNAFTPENTQLRFSMPHLRKILKVKVNHQSLMQFVIFFVLYYTFVIQYGWGLRNASSIDFPTFYGASVNFFRFGESPYDLEKLRLLISPRVYPYLYPPPSLLLFFPLSELTYIDARHALLIVNHLLFLLLIFTIPLCLNQS
jgi:hypothetical protein